MTTVERIKDAPRAAGSSAEPTSLAVASMYSEANREALARGMGKYVLAVPVGAITEVKTEVLRRAGRYRKIEDHLFAKEVVVGDGERRRRYQRVVEHTTGESWLSLRHQLNALQATEFRTATRQFFHRNEPTPALKRLFKKLEISMPNQVLAVHPLPLDL